MAEKKMKGDSFWRGTALVILCGLVYYFSYDHGRDAAEKNLAALRRETAGELEAQRREILRLHSALAECGREKPAVPAAAPPPPQPEAAPPPEKMVLRSGQSRILFGGQLVVTLLQVAGTENRALVQLNFLEEERLIAENVGAGGSFKFTLDQRNWALVASSMSISSATFDLVELKKNNE